MLIGSSQSYRDQYWSLQSNYPSLIVYLDLLGVTEMGFSGGNLSPVVSSLVKQGQLELIRPEIDFVFPVY